MAVSTIESQRETMLIIPAIDLKDGQCVRLRQGDMRQQTLYSSDPAGTARQWEQLGAEWLHVVDLDGAVEGEPRNFAHIVSVVKGLSIPVQVGGGIRSIETVRRYFSIGAQRVVVGTAALLNPVLLQQACAEFPDRVLAGIDARDGKVAIRGWTSVSDKTAIDLLPTLRGYSLAGVIYTDISKDGMLAGPNVTALREIAERSPVTVIASGGITSLDDLRAIKSLGPRIAGAIVGKALYDGKLDLKEAIQAVS